MILGEKKLSEDFGEESIESADDPPRVFKKGATFPGCAFTRSLGDAVGKTLGVCARPELLTYQVRYWAFPKSATHSLRTLRDYFTVYYVHHK